MYTDHSAVKAILNAPSPFGKHARWWTKAGVWNLKILHKPGKNNGNADALSRSPCNPAPKEGMGEAELQVAAISITISLLSCHKITRLQKNVYLSEKSNSRILLNSIHYLEDGTLPDDDKIA